jgi:hypothetical protein
MTPIVGVWVVIGLAVTFLFARRTARKMRERRVRQRRHLKRSVHRRHHHQKTTQRSEMRAYEDPTTVMGDITTTDRQKLRAETSPIAARVKKHGQ